MPRLREKIVPDPPEVIAARQRQQPVAMELVLAKDVAGTLVRALGNGEVQAWKEPYDEKEAKELRSCVANAYAFRWINSHPRRLAEARGPANRWVPVKKKDNFVMCPYAYGDETDGLFHMGDTILHMRDIDFHRQLASDRAYANDPDRYMKRTTEAAEEELARLGVTKVEHGVEPSERDAIEFTPEA